MTTAKGPTTLEYGLMGLVALKKSSGYDIQRIFVDTPMRQYSSSPGSIYPALERLEKRGLLKSSIEKTFRTRQRRLFELSDKGSKVLADWLSEPPTLDEIRSDIGITLLRFSLMEKRRNRRQIDEYLDTFETQLSAYLIELEDRKDAFREMNAQHAYLAIDNGIGVIHAHIAWAQNTRQAIGNNREK